MWGGVVGGGSGTVSIIPVTGWEMGGEGVVRYESDAEMVRDEV